MLKREITDPKPDPPISVNQETLREFQPAEVKTERREIVSVTERVVVNGVDTFYRVKTRRRLCRSSNIF